MKRAIVPTMMVLALFLGCSIATWADAQSNPQPQPAADSRMQSATPPLKYALHKEDVIKMTVWGEPNLSAEQVIDPAGYINLPKLGQLYVEGKTIQELTDKVKGELAAWVRDPKVQIEIVQFYRSKVYVLGQLNRPGTYEFRQGDRVMEAIAVAGSCTEAADLSNAVIWHKGADQKKIPIDLDKLFHSADLSQNLELQDGDTIFVGEDTMGKYAVVGEVLHQGQFRLKKNVTVMDAISNAGGATDRGALKTTYILRAGEKGPQRIALDMEKFVKKADLSQNIELKPGDVVYVPETSKPNWDKISRAISSVLNTSWLFKIWGL